MSTSVESTPGNGKTTLKTSLSPEVLGEMGLLHNPNGYL